MTERDALLAAVLADPADDLRRLALCDHLEESGDEADAARAEFIRVQVELAKHKPKRPRAVPMTPENDATWARLEQLRRRERELFAAHGSDWFDFRGVSHRLLCGEYQEERGTMPAFVVRRGFVSEVRCTAAAWWGGECGRCEGRGEWTSYRGPGTTGGVRFATCLACNGTGRTEGIGRRLVWEQPVTTVTLTDKEPGRDPQEGNPVLPFMGVAYYWTSTASADAVSQQLPAEWFKDSRAYQFEGSWVIEFPTRDEAMRWASARAIQWAKAQPVEDCDAK